jgi:uncharacterized protein (DUF488 family)
MAPELLTIGHSNHQPEHFSWLLDRAGVEVVADVRSWPHSHYTEWADIAQLPRLLEGQGRRYVFLGEELGGRPRDEECYDDAGHVLYGALARTASFRSGIARLRDAIATHTVAVMCSEEDPTHCHRRLLIAEVLMQDGVAVRHVRGDGVIEVEYGITYGTPSLFGEEDLWWRSTRSVSRRRQPSTFSSV